MFEIDKENQKTISEERAEEIIASIARIPLEMKSVQEFPMK